MKIRQAATEDVPRINELLKADTHVRELYGKQDVKLLIETGFLNVVAVEASNIIGFVSFQTHPPELEGGFYDSHSDLSKTWHNWFREYVRESSYQPTNSAWLYLYTISSEYSNSSVTLDLLTTVFATLPLVDSILAIVPTAAMSTPYKPIDGNFQCVELAPNATHTAARDDNPFQVGDRVEVLYSDDDEWYSGLIVHLNRYGMTARYDCIWDDGGRATGKVSEEIRSLAKTPKYQVYQCSRDTIIPSISVRQARVEDHDKLAPIFQEQTEIKAEIYGEYFIAELIQESNEQDVALVAEVDGSPVGLASLTSKIDTRKLREEFWLEEYNNLLPYSENVKETPRNSEATSDEKTDGPGLSIVIPQEPDAEGPNQTTFALTLFCLRSDLESRSHEFLSATFDQYPGRDYMVVTVPLQCEPPQFIQHLRRIHPRETSTFPQALYLLHRHSLNPDFTIRPARKDEAVEHMPNSPISTSSYVGVVDSQVVFAIGIADVEADDVGMLCKNFDVGSHVDTALLAPDTCATVVAWALNPIFSTHTRVILQEVMRQSGRYTLMYRIKNTGSVYPCLLSQCRQVAATRSRKGQTVDYSLYILSRRHLAFPQNDVNHKIVILGATDTGISCAARLMADDVDRLHNITIVDSSGEQNNWSFEARDKFAPRTLGYTAAEVDALALNTRTVQIKAKVKSLNIKDQCLELEDSSKLCYDILILSPPLEHYIPSALVTAGLKDGGKCTFDKVKIPKRSLSHVHLCTTSTDWEKATEDMMSLDKDSAPIILCGSGLEAISALHGIRQVTSHPIIRLMSGPDAEWSVSQHVRDTVCAKLEELDDVRSIACYDVTHLVLSLRDKSTVEGVLFNKKPGTSSDVCIRAFAEPDDNRLVGFDVPGFSREATLEVVNEVDLNDTTFFANDGLPFVTASQWSDTYNLECSCLLISGESEFEMNLQGSADVDPFVVDKRIIVDPYFKTGVPNIFACGPAANVSNRFGPSPEMTRCSPMEMGRKVADSVLATIGSNDDTPVSQFTEPHIIRSSLPGKTNGTTYFHSQRAKVVPQAELTTMHSEVNGCYTEVAFDTLGYLHSVTCYGNLLESHFVQVANVVGTNKCFFKGFDENIRDWFSYLANEKVQYVCDKSFQKLRKQAHLKMQNVEKSDLTKVENSDPQCFMNLQKLCSDFTAES